MKFFSLRNKNAGNKGEGVTETHPATSEDFPPYDPANAQKLREEYLKDQRDTQQAIDGFYEQTAKAFSNNADKLNEYTSSAVDEYNKLAASQSARESATQNQPIDDTQKNQRVQSALDAELAYWERQSQTTGSNPATTRPAYSTKDTEANHDDTGAPEYNPASPDEYLVNLLATNNNSDEVIHILESNISFDTDTPLEELDQQLIYMQAVKYLKEGLSPQDTLNKINANAKQAPNTK